MAQEIPDGWFIAAASGSHKGYGVQLMHKETMNQPVPKIESVADLLADRIGHVRGHSLVSMEDALAKAIEKARQQTT